MLKHFCSHIKSMSLDDNLVHAQHIFYTLFFVPKSLLQKCIDCRVVRGGNRHECFMLPECLCKEDIIICNHSGASCKGEKKALMQPSFDCRHAIDNSSCPHEYLWKIFIRNSFVKNKISLFLQSFLP